MERITMPQLGETVTEGTITRWIKQVGEAVAEDEALFEVSTDKVDTEVPSAHAGFLRVILVAEGATVPIGTPLAVLSETADEVLDEGVHQRADEGPSEPVDERRPGPGSATTTSPVGSTRQSAGGARRERARSAGGFLSPAVRRLLEERRLQPDEVVGSGEGGRITRADVLAADANRPARPRPVPAVAGGARPPPGPEAADRVVEAWPDDDIVELTRARRQTAEHMVRSLRTSAHTLVGVRVDYAGLDPLRRSARLSYLPFVARAVVDALREYPRLNASLGADALFVHRHVHLGVAVDVDFEALVVPVVKDAGAKRLAALDAEIAALAAKARSKRLSADDLSGGTFTLTNVGRYGTVVTFPVINQPQVAIMSTDGVTMTPVAVPTPTGEWAVAVHPVGNLSLVFDHRAVDGAYAAAFLARVRDVLEGRDWAGELS